MKIAVEWWAAQSVVLFILTSNIISQGKNMSCLNCIYVRIVYVLSFVSPTLAFVFLNIVSNQNTTTMLGTLNLIWIPETTRPRDLKLMLLSSEPQFDCQYSAPNPADQSIYFVIDQNMFASIHLCPFTIDRLISTQWYRLLPGQANLIDQCLWLLQDQRITLSVYSFIFKGKGII